MQFDQSVVDYVHTRKFPVLGRIAKWGLRAATAGVLVGVYQFNTNDIGEFSLFYVELEFLHSDGYGWDCYGGRLVYRPDGLYYHVKLTNLLHAPVIAMPFLVTDQCLTRRFDGANKANLACITQHHGSLSSVDS